MADVAQQVKRPQRSAVSEAAVQRSGLRQSRVDQSSRRNERRPRRADDTAHTYDQRAVQQPITVRQQQTTEVDDTNNQQQAGAQPFRRAQQLRAAVAAFKAARAAGGDVTALARLGMQVLKSLRNITSRITTMHLILLVTCCIWDGLGFVVEVMTGSLSSWLLFVFDFAFGLFFVLFSLFAFQQFKSGAQIAFRTIGGPVTTILEIIPIIDALPFWILNALVLVAYDIQATTPPPELDASQPRRAIPTRASA